MFSSGLEPRTVFGVVASLGIELRTFFWSSGLCFCILLLETNNFSLGVLSFRATGNALTGNRTETLFRSFEPAVLFLVSRNKHAKFGANRYIRSQAISEQTHKPTISTFMQGYLGFKGLIVSFFQTIVNKKCI
jgi:hypothetical protein